MFRHLYIRRFLVVVFSTAILLSCGGNTTTQQQEELQKVSKKEAKSEQLLAIHLYRYDDFPVVKAEMLKRELQKVYPSVVLEKASIELPSQYYYAPRNRYQGRGLLNELSRYKKGTVVLGLTDEVIYQANEKSPTFGIFGLSFVGKHVAVISITMASGKKQSDGHLVKLMLHEVGHAFGLSHCKDEHCFMVDAEHRNKFSQTPSFCKNCKSFLNARGWKLP